MSNIDKAATRERGFLDPKSKIMRDSREILHGKDWALRVKELVRRAQGNYTFPRCEYHYQAGQRIQRCMQQGCIPAHVIPRKDITQRDDRMSNLKFYCFVHDRLTEGQSWRKPRWGEKNGA